VQKKTNRFYNVYGIYILFLVPRKQKSSVEPKPASFDFHRASGIGSGFGAIFGTAYARTHDEAWRGCNFPACDRALDLYGPQGRQVAGLVKPVWWRLRRFPATGCACRLLIWRSGDRKIMAEQQQDDEQDQPRPQTPANQLFLDRQERFDGIVDFRLEIFL
jgi:hypothetical protein